MLWKVARVLSLGIIEHLIIFRMGGQFYCSGCRSSRYLFVIPGGANVLQGRKTFLMDRPGPGQGTYISIVDISIVFRLQTCFFLLFVFFDKT